MGELLYGRTSGRSMLAERRIRSIGRNAVYVRENAVIPIYPEDVDCTDEMDLSKSMALRIDNDYKGFGIDK